MSSEKTNRKDYESLISPARRSGKMPLEDASLKSPRRLTTPDLTDSQDKIDNTLQSPIQSTANGVSSGPEACREAEDPTLLRSFSLEEPKPQIETPKTEYKAKNEKERKAIEREEKALGGEKWLKRNGHLVSYIGVFLFTIFVFYRPYELIPGLGFLSRAAIVIAIVTLVVFIPSQFVAEGSFTAFPAEVKAVIALTILAFVLLPISKDPGLAWATLNETFLKCVLMFIVMVNVIRNRARLVGLMGLSLSIGLYLSYQAVRLYMEGKATVEGYRVAVDVKGMFENPNEMSLHFVMMIPIALGLGLGSKSNLTRLIYFSIAVLMAAANFVTFSRGGFLGLIVAYCVFVWKVARLHRIKAVVFSALVGLVVLIFAPGNYGKRILSIVGIVPDEAGSADQRKLLLERSIVVTLRNPWGIGFGNFPVVSIKNLETHNAFTQVSSELGILGLIVYLVFLINPFRRLGAIERKIIREGGDDWFYYVSIGLQASIAAYCVTSFFGAVAYNWFIYYLVAYAVAFRRVYQQHLLQTEANQTVNPV